MIMASHGAESTNSCEICGQEGFSNEELLSHMSTKHLEGASTCPFCDLGGVTYQEMLIHVNSAHLDYLTPDNELIGFIDEDDDMEPDGMVKNGVGVEYRESSQPCVPNVEHCKSIASSSNSVGGSIAGSTIVSHGLTGGQGQHGPGSPLRSSLGLRLHNEATPASSVLQCPLCPYKNSSATRVEEHVNREHLDPLSPSPPAPCAPSNEETVKDCPLCTAVFASSSDLELHVNVEHSNILSPQKPTKPVVNADGCPVCKRTGFACDRDLAVHLEQHFKRCDSTPDGTTDQLLARAVEQQEKYSRKLQEQKEFDMLRAQYGMDNQGNFKEQSVTNMRKAVYSGELTVAAYYEREQELRMAENYGIDDGTSCTKDIIPKIYSLSSSSRNVNRTYLCSTLDHYASNYGDKGWGCGYRNMQMMLSSLMRHTGYSELMYRESGGLCGMTASQRGSMPCISKLQKHIEWAWSIGFDRQGCEQLGGQVHNTRKWIGTTEMVTVLASLRFRCELIDFHRPTAPDGSHPQLFNWILQYFQKKDDFKSPLYLQHQGHSRTVVGIEVLSRGVNLLVLDPSHSPRQMSLLCDTATGANAMRLIRKTSNSMKARQYQLVCVTGIMESEQEYQRCKILTSTSIPND